MNEPDAVPIATRAWCRRSPHVMAAPPKPARRRPEDFVAIHIAGTGAGMPAATIGAARIGSIAGGKWRTWLEIWFYGPAASASEIAALQEFITRRTLPRGAGGEVRVWSDEIGVRVDLMPLASFMEAFYELCWSGHTLCVGHDLPAMLGSLAVSAGAARETVDEEEGWRPLPDTWSLAMLPSKPAQDGKPGWSYPRIRICHAQPGIDFIGFAPTKQWVPGLSEFLSTRMLGQALTGESFDFIDAVAELTGEVVEGDGPEEEMLSASRALVGLASTLVGYFDLLHPGLSRKTGGPLSECKIFSAGSIARAYQTAAGYSPAPTVPDDMLGLCATATHGAWCGISTRGSVPVSEIDFRRQYAVIAIKQEIGRLCAGRRIDFVEATEEIRERAATLTEQDLGPLFNALCLVKLQGEPMLTRALYGTIGERKPDAPDFSLAVSYRTSGDPIPAYLAHVVAARMLDPKGRVPEIVRAWKIVPADIRPLTPVNLMGTEIDPAETPLPLAFVREGARLEKGEAPYEDIPDRVRKWLVSGIKAAGNIAAYGSHLQTNIARPTDGTTEEITLLHAGPPLTRKSAAPENDTHLTCVPAGGLVAASGMMLLASMHKKLRDRGAIAANWDTDSVHVAASRDGGEYFLDTRGRDGGSVPEKASLGPDYRPRGEKIRLLSWVELDEIIAEYRPLNPFPDAYPEILRLTAENFNERSERQTLIGHYLSGKRYSLETPDGDLIDTMASGLGIYLPPTDDPLWLVQAWRYLNARLAFKPPPTPDWLDIPLVRQLAVTTPESADQLPGLSGIYPGRRYLAGQVVDIGGENAEPRGVVADFCDDPHKWAALSWHALDGNPVDLGKKTRLLTWGQYLDSYVRRGIASALGPDGKICGTLTRGLLHFRHIRDGKRFLALKEAAVYGEEADEAFDLPKGEVFAIDEEESRAGVFAEVGPPAIAAMGIPAVAAALKLPAKTIERWAKYECSPKKPDKILKRIEAVAFRFGLVLTAADPSDPAEICRLIPGRVSASQRFASLALRRIADHYGIPALAAALQVAGRTVYARMQDDEPPLSFKAANETIASLSRFCIADAGGTERLCPTENGPLGERQVILAYLDWLAGRTRKPVIPPSAEIYRRMAEMVQEQSATLEALAATASTPHTMAAE